MPDLYLSIFRFISIINNTVQDFFIFTLWNYSQSISRIDIFIQSIGINFKRAVYIVSVYLAVLFIKTDLVFTDQLIWTVTAVITEICTACLV